ncbi:MAG: hypothetical protein P4L82_12170 [Ancalomicrobiaceae bacterium]|nr:hypothetical protein [Ancalomicrobiaceae bacterium]
MGSIKIRYYRVVKGQGYWTPSSKMRTLGFSEIRCGRDGPDAWRTAKRWADRWASVKEGKEPAPASIDLSKLSREQAEAARVYPRGSVGEAWGRYIRTEEWKRRPQSTRTKEWWPAWFRIRDMWGDVDPATITFEMMSAWRNDPVHGLEAKHGCGVAHKTFKVWRAFWNLMASMHYCDRDKNPSLGIVNKAPAPRDQRFNEGEAVRWVKGAWRLGYHGLACIMAVAWDSGMSPGDIRTLRARHRKMINSRLAFDLSKEGRAKTGRSTIGTTSPRTAALLDAYWHRLGVEMTADAFLFRTRSGGKYRDDTLADDFASMREKVAPGDKRQLRDMRRSGAMEALAGGASGALLSQKLANSIQSSNTLQRTYTPVDIAAVEAADEARLIGRRRTRGAKGEQEFSTQQPRLFQPKQSSTPKPLK